MIEFLTRLRDRWLNQGAPQSELQEVEDAIAEAERLQKIAKAADLVSSMSSYDEDTGEVYPCHMVDFEELEAALLSWHKSTKNWVPEVFKPLPEDEAKLLRDYGPGDPDEPTKDSDSLPCCGSESGVHLIGCQSEDALAGRIHRPAKETE